MFDLRIVAILTANDDGSQAAGTLPADIASSVKLANNVYNPHGVNFLFDPATDIYQFNDDWLNRDCIRRDHELYTNKDADPARKKPVLLRVDDCNNRRNEVALRFPGRITVFFTAGNRYRWDNSENRWVYGPRGFSWSNHFDEFVSMARQSAGDYILAHELGHYLHLQHTFLYQPSTMQEAIGLIVDHVENQNVSKDNVVATIFDGDKSPLTPNGHIITDTPPDSGPKIFTNQCNNAENSVRISVGFSDGSHRDYVLTPDRENIMNYWRKCCRGPLPSISHDQAERVIKIALERGNRKHLIDPAVLYCGVWADGDRSQTRAIGWAMQDFESRFNKELNADRRCVHMQAYDLGGGQIRWDGVWEPASGNAQSYALGWAMQDFASRFNNELLADKHCVHMQAYDLGGGQIRWDGIWETASGNAQSYALGWAMQDFASRFNNELLAGKHCVHMQAYDLGGGQIRWDGIWETASGNAQSYALGWAIQDFAPRFNNELLADKHCVHMQAYDLGGGQIRWDGIWETGGNNGQSRAIGWAFNDFVNRCDQEISDGRRLVHLQAYDIGSGQLRYDAIWETPGGLQKRALALPLMTFADHFDELTSSGYHMELMTACHRIYPTVRARVSALRMAEFGSDVDKKPAYLESLSIPSLSERGCGCDLELEAGLFFAQKTPHALEFDTVIQRPAKK